MEKEESRVDRLLKLRECSKVRRAHTVPYHGDYTVGQHSFDMLVLLLELHPNPSRLFMKVVVYHDFGERWVGDVPANTKWANAEFKNQHELIEKAAMKDHGIPDYLDHLDALDLDWFHALDKLELYMWAEDQVANGNRAVQEVVDNLLGWFKEKEESHRVPPEIITIVEQYEYRRTRG